MIVAMKKIFLIMQSKDAHQALLRLRKMGVLHVEHLNSPKGGHLPLLNDELALISQAVSALVSFEEKNVPHAPANLPHDWRALARHIIDLYKRYEQLREFSLTLASRIDQWSVWGDFDPQQIARLQSSGLGAGLYKLTQEEIRQLPKDIYLKVISRQGNSSNCLIISFAGAEIPFKALELPKDSLSRMQERYSADKKTRLQLKDEILKHIVYLGNLENLRKGILKEVEFQEALCGMQQEEGLVYIKGFIPYYSQQEVEQASRSEGWGVLVAEPAEDDNVPTLMRNPAWASIVRPVLKLLEIVPGYRELDISPLFLIFFSLFFGMLIGDAGYGAVYLFLTFLAHKKMGGRVKDKGVFFLFYLLSSCAIIWGVLVGAFFGQEWLLKAGYRPLAASLNNVSFIQAFCFLIGAVHLSIAHSWRAALKLPSLTALADIGWILVLWAAFFIAKTLLLGDLFPGFGKWLLSAGLILVLFFTNPQKNILKAMGEGLGTIALGLMNNFTDVVSYVRLFAVGLAGFAIADAFNAMAAGINNGGLFAAVMSAVILSAGHGLNLVLGPMSVLVHGVRLNVLEFSGHANVAWSGFEYKPLKEE